MTAVTSESLVRLLPPVATSELVGRYADPSAETLAVAGMHIAHGLATEKPFNTIDASNFVGELATLVGRIKEPAVELLSPDAHAALQGCSQLSVAYRTAAQGPRPYLRPSTSAEEPNDLDTVRRNIRDFSVELGVTQPGSRNYANLELTARHTLPLFGSALGVVCMDLAKGSGYAMDRYTIENVAGDLRRIGGRFLVQHDTPSI